MKLNNLNTQANSQANSIGSQARLLMSQNRAKQHNRQQSMLHRVATEVGLNG